MLELACGTGRLLAPLVGAGFDVTGVDSSVEMLDRARRRLAEQHLEATLVQQRLESLHVDGRFRTIIIGLDSFGLLYAVMNSLPRCRPRVRTPRTMAGWSWTWPTAICEARASPARS